MDTLLSLLTIAGFIGVLGLGVAATFPRLRHGQATPRLESKPCTCGFYTCSYCGECHNPLCGSYEPCSEV